MADGEEKQRQFPEKKQIRQQTAQPKRRSKSWGDMKRYESLARNISDSILSGVLKFGDQLPSVRQASSSRGVSASTVFKAYYLLEAQGLIAARERQGYFVIASPRGMPPQPEAASQPAAESTTVDVSELVFKILESAGTREVVPFGSAFPSPLLFPTAALTRSMSAALPKQDPWSTVDYLTQGLPALRREIALRYLIDGQQVSPAEIVITNGALEALHLCLIAVTKPGDAVVIESPCFYGVLQTLERLCLKAISVTTHPSEGIDLAALEAALLLHRPTACWLMTNFQNPLGSSMPAEKKQALVELLAEHEVPLIEDDVYGELYYGQRRPLPAKAYDRRGLVMHCGSFSKCLAPGYRIGWALPGRQLQQVARLQLTSTLSASAPAQEALANYLARGRYDHHLRALRYKLASNQHLMTHAISRYFPAGTAATRPTGGYFMWLQLPSSVDALEIHRLALAQGISVAPGPIFSPQHGYGNCLRLNYGHLWDERTEAAAALLGRLIATQV